MSASALAWPSPEQITVRMWWAMGVVFFIALVVVVLLVAYITGKLLLWRSARRQAGEQAARDKLGPDGRPLPPSGFGLCDSCGRAEEEVYYVRPGQRLCADCYNALHQPPSAAAGQARHGSTEACAPGSAENGNR